MHQNIKWADSHTRKSRNPFDKGQIEQPLRITFHDSTLKELPDNEKAALDVLREFAEVESQNLEVLGTEPSKRRYLEIGEQSNNNLIPVSIRFSGKNLLQTGIRSSNQLRHLAKLIVQRLGENPSNNEQALQDLIVAKAHQSVHQDLLVTTSKWLLGNREIGFLVRANPCLPSEAIKVMGLLFRARGDFRYAAKASLDKGLFYWALVRYRLPTMWKYFSACVYSEKLRGDDIDLLGESILMRCGRAIQACDEIGRLFYMDQNNNTRDDAMYHFDYLTLLLSGALDAQARVAYRAYQLAAPKKEHDASFRREEFLKEISKADKGLSNFLCSDYFKDISNIISKMRNTIHGAGLTTIAYQNGMDSEKSFVKTPDTDAQVIWDISEKYNSALKWGVIKLGDMILFEPYAFSQEILNHTIEIVNNIASLTQVEKLFPSGTPIPELASGPPANDHIFDTKIGERLSLLT